MIAEDEAKRILNQAEIELIGQISDEIIATAEEYIPNNLTECYEP